MPENDLDFSKETVTDVKGTDLEVGGEYDPRPQEDNARRIIAYLLIGLLWLIVSGMFLLLSFSCIKVTELKEFGAVLSPVIALVSAATGFYYGTKSSPAANGGKP